MKQPEFLNTERAANVIGCSARQLQWWDQKGVLPPMRGDRDGAGGMKRLYRAQDIQRGKIIVRLLKAGVRHLQIRKAMVGVVLIDAPFLVYQRGHRLRSFESATEVLAFMKSTPAGSVLIECER